MILAFRTWLLGLKLDTENKKDVSNWRVRQAALRSCFLEGNFAPVDGDVSYPQVEVTGSLPEGFEGMFARVGPNPRFIPKEGYTWFDGDGMVHGVLFKGGTASYTRHQVRTTRFPDITNEILSFTRYIREQSALKSLYVRLSQMKGLQGLYKSIMMAVRAKLGIINSSPGNGTIANTALEYHAGRLWVLAESDSPFSLRVKRDGTFESMGPETFQGRLNAPFTAHPKIDPEDGCMYSFGYRVDQAPYLTYHLIGANGLFIRSVPITIPNPVSMHDFAITAKYVIFTDHPFIFRPNLMIRNNTWPLTFDETRASRIGILPKHSETDSTRWFEVPACYSFHVLNAWEEGEDLVHLVACVSDTVDLKIVEKAGEDTLFILTLFTFNLRTGHSNKRRLVPTEISLDFPRVPARLVGRKARYGYCVQFTLTTPNVAFAVVKLDLQSDAEDIIVGRINFGDNTYGGECIFVPRYVEPDRCDGEDDGFLVTFNHDINGDTSKLVAYDAKTMSEYPAFTVCLPERVPYGFHAIWIDQFVLGNLMNEGGNAEEAKEQTEYVVSRLQSSL